jgi:ParB-like chromosome segregation protein Spo0J
MSTISNGGSGKQTHPTVNYGEYEAHPAADEFPLMQGEDFDKLVADIEAHGQRQPVVLCPDGRKIADGRNRFRACQRLGIDPLFATLGPEFDTDEKIADYVKSANLQRLHLDASQRAMIAARLATRYGEGGKERSSRNLRRGRSEATSSDAAQMRTRRLVRTPRDHSGDAAERAAREMDVSPRYVQAAQRLQAEAPDLADEVTAGRLKLTAADKRRRQRRSPTSSRPTRAQDDIAKMQSVVEGIQVTPAAQSDREPGEEGQAPAQQEMRSRPALPPLQTGLNFSQEQTASRIVDSFATIEMQVRGAYLANAVFPNELHQGVREFRERVNQWTPKWLGEGD